MSAFFDVCVICKRTFSDEGKFIEHMKTHDHSAVHRKPIEEVEERVRMEAKTVPGATMIPDEDARLAAVRKVNAKRKKLIAAGVEAATMTPEEVETRYAEEKKKGTVK